MNGEQPPYQSKRERREQRREEERRARQRNRFMRQVQNYAIAAISAIAIGFGLYFLMQGAAPEGEDFSRPVPVMGEEHINIGSPLPEYNSNPPTSGPHYEQTARSGFREEEIPDQHIIHNLEHGDVWIAYHPRIADSAKEALKQFAAAKVIITPREANDADIALAAWGRLDTFDLENNAMPVTRIKDFIRRYTNKGPEQIFGASGGI